MMNSGNENNYVDNTGINQGSEYDGGSQSASPNNVPQGGYYHNRPVDEPLSIGTYILMIIISAIPIVGFIVLIVWSFDSTVNKNKSNYAKAVLILKIIGFILLVLFMSTMASMLGTLFNSLEAY